MSAILIVSARVTPATTQQAARPETTMTKATYATIARLAGFSVSDAEQWCASHDVSATEAVRIWTAANGSEPLAQSIWENEDSWTDANNA